MSINWEDYEEPLKKPKNPLVLIGCGVTAGVLFAGLVAFKKGNQGLSQKMMRARVIAQGATVALMVASSGYVALTSKKDPVVEGLAGDLDKQLK
ncbi:hypothetical protein ACKKBF_B11020 [Auxenochlorella protothecoides x Auxenochlorella symbiontica]|uniref:HIG1 domain-containing protein n=1 Tax=Auxenochlorella protothecoides TaxID=3075 RepID=A0A3M7KYV0_AUXPR|nr:hypothetical protein APUTEX25_000507 [Auxenochlorella protothecoides]|eukprot:RMZ54990.1 hypothetical protein APUTEX25_000507 [Auxenochlorella protothecoides]